MHTTCHAISPLRHDPLGMSVTTSHSLPVEAAAGLDVKWLRIECAIRDNLQLFENSRKFCAYCGLKETSAVEPSSTMLGRCYGCQMVYYCSQEHQSADWLENHMPKCAELEWVALGELIQSIPASPALTSAGMPWPREYWLKALRTWTDWFDIRTELVEVTRQTALMLERTFFTGNSQSTWV